MPQLPAFSVEGRRSALWRARHDRFGATCQRDAAFAERLLQAKFLSAVGALPLVMRAGAERTITSGERDS
ncbi:hypothetical protein [Sphingomonas sp. CFBP 13733]|uniref:hypothetical protein n=1 Tax=Sphingomonas sp. CFBP 13733 TaxID=2775291 RepID=UPI0017804B0B|nr:hypothetical protein [Sphingomonas sp. CFBP 13733]MBD8640286.1 hypothetical protein [Sphingomonas sp. CFBP 13733]